MKIAGYTLTAHPARNEAPIFGAPRTKIVPTLGGIRLTVMPGHIGDELHTIPFAHMDAAPARTLLREYADLGTPGDTVATGERLAYKIPVAAADFAAVSAARLRLLEDGAMTGHVSVEVWDSAAGIPSAKRGVLGHLTADDIGLAYANYDVWAMPAWPIDTPEGWLVLNAAEEPAGVVTWAGELTEPNGHACSPYAGRSTGAVNPVVDMTAHPLQVDMNIAVDGGAPNAVVFNWGACNSGVLVAAQMQTVIQALGGAFGAVTVVYVPDAGVSDHYLVTSGTRGAASDLVITDGAPNNCADELKLGVANAGVETTGGTGWGLANGELCGSVWQGADYPVLLGLCEYYGSQQQSVEVELDNDTRVFKAVLADIRGGYSLVPWELAAGGRASGVAIQLLIEGELS